MKIRTFFHVTMGLLLAGTFASSIALFLPLFLPNGVLSTAGDLSAGVSAVFGISIACLALFVYLYRDSTEQKIADRAFEAKEVLEDALVQASSLMKLTAENNCRIPGTDTLIPGTDRCVQHALVILKDAAAEARKTPLYAALSSVSEYQQGYNPADLLLTLEAHVSADLNERQPVVSPSVFISIPYVYDALSSLTPDNIKKHSAFAHGRRGEIEFIRNLSEQIREQIQSCRRMPEDESNA